MSDYSFSQILSTAAISYSAWTIGYFFISAVVSSPLYCHRSPDLTKEFYKRIVSLVPGIGFPSRLDLSVVESVLSLDPGAWHRLLSGLLDITSNILVSASITPVRAACIGLRVTLPRWFNDSHLQERMDLHSITESLGTVMIRGCLCVSRWKYGLSEVFSF